MPYFSGGDRELFDRIANLETQLENQQFVIDTLKRQLKEAHDRSHRLEILTRKEIKNG